MIVFTLYVVCGCAPRPLVVKVSDETPPTPQQEVQLGLILTDMLIQYLGGDHPEVSLESYVNQVARRLVTADSSQRIQVRVANHSDVYSLTLPGGFIVVTRGLLQELESESQLAALLAREIGYSQSDLVAESMKPIVRGRAVFLQDVQPGDALFVQRLLLTRELTDVALHRGYGSEIDYSVDIATIDKLVHGNYSLNGFFELDQMWQRLNRAATDSGRSVYPDPLSELRLQAARDYITTTYPDYHGAKELHSDTDFRQLVSPDQLRPAYRLYDQARSAEMVGEQTRALQLYHQAIQEQPLSMLLAALGMAYLRGEDLIPARRYLRQSVAVDAEYYQSRLGLGYIHLRRSEWSDAAAELEASLALFPTLQGTFLLAETEEGRGHGVRARNLYRHLLEVDGQSALGRAAAERLRQLPR